MFTKDQLQQLREVIREETEPINKRLSGLEQGQQEQTKDIKSLKEDVKTLKEDVKTVDMKVELVNKRVETVDAKIETGKQETNAIIEREIEVIANSFQETWDRMDTQAERTTRLEEHTRIHSKN